MWGALNATFLAQASIQGISLSNLKKKVESLYNLWRYEIKGNHSVYAEKGGFAGIVVGMDSLYSLEPLRALINKHVKLKYLRNSGRDFKVGTVSLVSARYNECGPDDPHFMDKLIASASIPVVFPYADLKSVKDVLIDGGVRNISPLSSAFNAKPQPDEIYVLLASRLVKEGLKLPESGVQEHDYERWDDNRLGTKVSGLDVLKRTIEILTDEVYLDDIRGALEWNEIVKKIDAVREASQTHTLPDNIAKTIEELTVKKRHVPLFVLAPQEWFGDENKSTEFSPSLIEQAINHGREIAADTSKWVCR